MKPIERNEVLGIAEYEVIRDRFRARVIEEKKRRRVALGPKATCVFENRDSVLLQIQEMLRTERITREAAIQHEIETYNQLVPGAGELSVTIMIEIPEKEEREAFLVAARGFEKHVVLAVGSERMRAVGERVGAGDERTTAVHYLKFPLTARAAAALRGATSPDTTIAHVEVEVDHPAYAVRVPLPAETIVSLGEDLVG
jgi:Protein of unknown function (DUF3501)